MLAVSAGVLATAAVAALNARGTSADERRLDYRPAAYAIKGATVVTGRAAGEHIDNGTVIVRAGVIEAVGPGDKTTVPPDAETIDGKGMVVYPGFLDLYSSIGVPSGVTRSLTGPGRPINYAEFAFASTPPDNRNGITPEFETARVLDLSDATAEERRKLGFTDYVAAPAGAIATGQSALVSLSGLPRRETIVRSPVALHINPRPPFEPKAASDGSPTPDPVRRRGQGPPQRGYPTSLMGAIAHLRQAMLDADYQAVLMNYYNAQGGPRPPFDPSLQTLRAARSGLLPVWWEANSRDEIHRVLDLAREFGTSAVIFGARDAAKVSDRLKSVGAPVVLRVDFPEKPKVPDKAEHLKKSLADRDGPLRLLESQAKSWDERVATASKLAQAGVKFAFSSEGVTRADEFPGKIRAVIEHGLSRDAAVLALTRHAAEIAGVGDRLGTIEVGKLGHLVVLTGPLGDEKSKVRYLLIDGQKFDTEKPAGAISKKASGRRKGAEGGGNAPEPSKAAEKAKEAAHPKSKDAPKQKPLPDSKPKPQPQPEKSPATRPDPKADAKPKVNGAPKGSDDAKKETSARPEAAAPKGEPAVVQDPAVELEADRKTTIHTGGDILIKDAVVLTVGPKGTLPRGSILIRKGKIAAVGTSIEAPPGVTVLDASGLVAMPGIIDTHSHMAIQGGVNEMSLSIVPEVRVRDVVEGEDVGVYRALAGGTTTARLLHGSANTIGGQDVVIKHKFGLPGRETIVKGGPQGVKFALGENVTRARTRERFPSTRMGVESVIDRAFQEAKAYQDTWKVYDAAKAKGKAGTPPRRDLRLEALAGILDGSIKIHSHCYRNDEILMLLNVASRHGVRVQSLQHVLEGYKVAAEIAAHGASASTFSDWWAYKTEAFDAIPFNAALLTEAGVNVCIKSDSNELVRHLYLEAAKMVKYGVATEEQALRMITLNPARELGLQDRLGSIEVGKDGDVALFNAHPFDGFARCEMSIVDGEVWFQRKEPGGKPTSRPGTHAAMPAAAVAADLRKRPLDVQANAKGLYALVGGRIHPVSGPVIERGTVVVASGKIAAVGGVDVKVPEQATSIDVTGLEIWPGLVDAGSPIGLFEVGSLPETQDYADLARFQPELLASSALHPDSELIPVTRANGVLTALTIPLGGTISGQACLIKLDGWVPREMVIADRLGLVVNIPDHVPTEAELAERTRMFGGMIPPPGPEARQARTRLIEDLKLEFRRAKDYDAVVTAARSNQVVAPPPDPRLAALAPYAKGEKLVIFVADHPTEILDALAVAKELKLKAAISGGEDAWKVASAIKEANVPVLVSGTLRVPSTPHDPYDASYSNPLRLHEAGIRFAIRSIGQGPDQATSGRNLPYEAATAVAYGLPEEVALRAVTITPAEILGVADQVGSIEVGKRAQLVITAGNILQPTTVVKALFIDGKPLTPASRHTRLYEKFKARLDQVRGGIAPLGIDAPRTNTAAPGVPREGTSGSNATEPASNRR